MPYRIGTWFRLLLTLALMERHGLVPEGMTRAALGAGQIDLSGLLGPGNRANSPERPDRTEAWEYRDAYRCEFADE